MRHAGRPSAREVDARDGERIGLRLGGGGGVGWGGVAWRGGEGPRGRNWRGSKTRNGGERVRFPLGRNRNLLLRLFLSLSPFLAFFLARPSRREPRFLSLSLSLSPPSLSLFWSHAHASAQIRAFSLPLLPRLAPSCSSFLDPFSLSSPLAVPAARSAPDYLGSECLIEALYR